MDLARCTTLLINLTLGEHDEHLQILGERRGVMHKSGICNISETKQSMSQSYYRVSIETRIRPIDWWQTWWPTVNFGLLFRRAKFSTTDILYTFCQSATKFGRVRGMANRNLFPKFRELWSGVSYDSMRCHASVLHWHTCYGRPA